MWKVEIWFSLSFVGYVSSDSLNLSIQLAILHPWMFLHLIWYSLPSNSRYLVWNCFEFTTAVWFWHPEYIADKKIVYVQWFFFYVVQHFFPGIFSFELDDYALFGWLISRSWGWLFTVATVNVSADGHQPSLFRSSEQLVTCWDCLLWSSRID